MIYSENDKHAEFHRPAPFYIFILPLKMNKKEKKTHFMHHFYESTQDMLSKLYSAILCNTPTKKPALAEAKKEKKQEFQPTSVTSHSAAAWLCGNVCVHAHAGVKRPVRAHTCVSISNMSPPLSSFPFFHWSKYSHIKGPTEAHEYKAELNPFLSIWRTALALDGSALNPNTDRPP